jgi:hypothetical protein
MVLERWNPPDFDRFVDGEFDAGRLASPRTVTALLEAIPLVLAECGVPDDARLGAVGRRAVLAWAVAEGVGDDVLMEIFGQPSVPALRKASRRAQALVEAEPKLVVARRRAIDLISCDTDITGLTRDVRQSAARAAS